MKKFIVKQINIEIPSMRDSLFKLYPRADVIAPLFQIENLAAFGAFDEDQIIGNVFCFRSDEIWIAEAIYVNEENRRHGIAKSLASSVRDYLMNLTDEIFILVRNDNLPSQNLIAQMGFHLRDDQNFAEPFKDRSWYSVSLT